MSYIKCAAILSRFSKYSHDATFTMQVCSCTANKLNFGGQGIYMNRQIDLRPG